MSEKNILLQSTTELLAEAAGVKIFMTPESSWQQLAESLTNGKITVTLKNFRQGASAEKCYGFHLTKSKWDPYPWISCVEAGSLADASGLRAGDCLININNVDLAGLKIKAVAALIHNDKQEHNTKLSVWRYDADDKEQTETGLALKGPLPDVAGKLANAVSGTVRALECPVCLESSMPPISQCVHGHIICSGCRPRTSRCPVCRVRLGQGRCLLADKLHRVLRDVFGSKEDAPNDGSLKSYNLRDYLFGRGNKKFNSNSTPEIKNNTGTPKVKASLLARLLIGGAEKAASADNLTTISESTESSANLPANSNDCGQRLKLHDRMKSASTGELAGGTKNQINNVPLERSNSSAVSSTASLVSNAVQTPIWGGSMDSLSCNQVACPLLKQTGCKDIISPVALLKHLRRTHEATQIHFYSANVKIPLPLPFGVDAVYILHCGMDIFFFQYDMESAWIMSSSDACQTWQWLLHGIGKDGTEIKLRRNIASLEEPIDLGSRHIAPLPNSLLLHTLNIRIVEYRSNEELDI